LTDHSLVKVGDYDDAKVDIARTADVSGFQTELDLDRIFMQVIRTLGQLSYCDRELALDVIVCCVFEIELSGVGQEAQKIVILARQQACLQFKAIFSVFFSLVQDGGVKGILLLQTELPVRTVFHLTIGADEMYIMAKYWW